MKKKTKKKPSLKSIMQKGIKDAGLSETTKVFSKKKRSKGGK